MHKIYFFLFALLALQLILAFICGPHSCEWGNAVYFYVGVAILLVAFALPFFHADWEWLKRFGVGLLFLLASAIVWVLGFMAAGFSIICRLF